MSLLLLLFRVAQFSAHRRVPYLCRRVPSGLLLMWLLFLCRLGDIVKNELSPKLPNQLPECWQAEVAKFVFSIKRHFKEIEEASAELKQQAVTGVIGIEASKDCWEKICSDKKKPEDSELAATGTGVSRYRKVEDVEKYAQLSFCPKLILALLCFAFKDANINSQISPPFCRRCFKEACSFHILRPDKEGTEDYAKMTELIMSSWIPADKKAADMHAMWFMHMILFETVSFGNPPMIFKDDFDFFGPVHTFKCNWSSGYYLSMLAQKEVQNAQPGALVFDCGAAKTHVYACDLNEVGTVSIKQQAPLDFNIKELVFKSEDTFGGGAFYNWVDEHLGRILRWFGTWPTLEAMKNRREFVRVAAQLLGSGLDVFVLAQTESFR